MLYSGGFFSNDDRARMEIVHQTEPDQLGELELPFSDARLTEMLFRYQARNYPETLNKDEKNRWDEFRAKRLTDSSSNAGLKIEKFREIVAGLRQQDGSGEKGELILDELEKYVKFLLPD